MDANSTNTHIVHIPEKLNSNLDGYNFLSRLAGSTLDFVGQEVIIDFQDCIYFSGNLSAVLGNVLRGLLDRKNDVEFINVQGAIIGILSINGFLKSFESNYSVTAIDASPMSIPYERFQLKDEGKVKDFVKASLFDKPGMPKMSPSVQKEILVNIFEVCVNAITHGGCEHVYCCGQMFPKAIEPSVVISFADLGKTIPANVNEFKSNTKKSSKPAMTGCESILWAMKEGNTTKTGNEPGGIGLKILQNLVNANKGSLHIVSGNGYIKMTNGVFEEYTLVKPFPGTIVTLEIKLNDPKLYVLSSEVASAGDIF